MTTVLNTTGQVMQLEWCSESAHWSDGLHGAGDSGLPDILVPVSIQPDSLLTYDETQPNGAAIGADVSAMQEIP